MADFSDFSEGSKQGQPRRSGHENKGGEAHGWTLLGGFMEGGGSGTLSMLNDLSSVGCSRKLEA